jgi:hypothetical protein
LPHLGHLARERSGLEDICCTVATYIANFVAGHRDFFMLGRNFSDRLQRLLKAVFRRECRG